MNKYLKIEIGVGFAFDFKLQIKLCLAQPTLLQWLPLISTDFVRFCSMH